MRQSIPKTSIGVPLKTVIAVVAVGIGLVVAWRLADILLLLFAAIVVATSLRAMAEAIHRWTRISVRLGVIGVSALLLIGAIVATLLFGASIRAEVVELVRTLPGTVDAVGSLINMPDLAQRLSAALQQFLFGEPLLGQMASYTGNALSSLAVFFLAVMASVYLALDPDLYRRGLLRLIPPGHRAAATAMLDDGRESLRHWLIGQTLTAIYVGGTSGLVFWLIGLPHAAALGLIAGLLEFVPYIGGLIASVPALLIALSTGDPWTMLWVGLACLVIQQFEGNLLSPLIQQWAVRLPPVVGLFAMIALGTIFGPLGVLLATPLTVVAIVLVKHLYVALILRDGSILERPPIRPGAEAGTEGASSRAMSD